METAEERIVMLVRLSQPIAAEQMILPELDIGEMQDRNRRSRGRRADPSPDIQSLKIIARWHGPCPAPGCWSELDHRRQPLDTLEQIPRRLPSTDLLPPVSGSVCMLKFRVLLSRYRAVHCRQTV